MQDKSSVLKDTRGKTQITNKDKHIRISVDFSVESLKARRAWNQALKVLKDYASQPRLMCPAKLSDKAGEERKAFHNINSLKIFMFNKSNLKKIQDAVFQTEEDV